MLVSELLVEYIQSNIAIKSEKTERLLSFAVKHFDASLGRPAVVGDFNDRNIAAYMRFRRQQGRAETTIEPEAAKLLALWRFASTRGLAPVPTIKIRKQRPAVPIALFETQIRKLFEASQLHAGTVGGLPASIYFPALLGVAWDTAERIGAVLALERSDINLDRGEITFRVRKGQGRTLIKPIRQSTNDCVRALMISHDREHPFAVVKATSLYHHMGKILREAEINPRKNKFHALRRSHASYLKAAGGDARMALDHTSEQVTNDHYIDPRICGSQSSTSLLFDPFEAGWRAKLSQFMRRLKFWKSSARHI